VYVDYYFYVDCGAAAVLKMLLTFALSLVMMTVCRLPRYSERIK